MASGRKRRKPSGKWRSVVFFLLLGVSLSIAVSLVSPPSGFLSDTGHFFRGFLGVLSAFVPLTLFLTGARVLKLHFAGKWLAVTGSVFVCAFFFSALLSMVLGRINPGLLSVAGGELAARSVLALEGLAGSVVGWIILFVLFMVSIVVFTGWNIGEDINSLSGRKRTRRRKPEPAVREKPVAVVTRPEPVEIQNPWMEQEEQKTAVKPEIVIEPAVKTAPAGKKSQPVKTEVPTPVSDSSSQDSYHLPGSGFLTLPAPSERRGQTKAEVEERAQLLVDKLAAFGVECTIADHCPGPVLTRYELTPGPGVKVNRILNLADDLALALAAKRIRILAPIPGKGAVGIEVPNRNPETVYLREIIDHLSSEKLPVALGKKLEGQPFIADLTEMPHLLIAGATGSGKSVCVHAIISTILMTRTPYQVRLAMVDPKMLELSAYKGIPHLWAPVVIQASRAKFLLEALVREMEERYSLLARTGVRDIKDYNKRFGADQVEEHLPYIVVIIDELADLMMVSARDVEPPIARLAQMARAVGIHLVVATQRPSVDVITGVIKANFPSRIAFNVQSKTDSRTILDMNGAEKLLGKGDMLFVPAGAPEARRVHGSFISTEETRALVEYWKDQPELPFEYEPPEDDGGNLYDPGELDFDDPLLDEVKNTIIADQRASVSMIQRKFRVGYARAGKLIDMLEKLGVVGPHLGSKPREVLVRPAPPEETNDS